MLEFDQVYFLANNEELRHLFAVPNETFDGVHGRHLGSVCECVFVCVCVRVCDCSLSLSLALSLSFFLDELWMWRGLNNLDTENTWERLFFLVNVMQSNSKQHQTPTFSVPVSNALLSKVLSPFSASRRFDADGDIRAVLFRFLDLKSNKTESGEQKKNDSTDGEMSTEFFVLAEPSRIRHFPAHNHRFGQVVAHWRHSGHAEV